MTERRIDGVQLLNRRTDCDGQDGFGSSRDVYHKRASLAWPSADLDVATLCPDGLSSDRQTESEACSVLRPALTERLEEVALARRNPSARILHFDGDAPFCRAVCSQDHAATRPCVLERITQ